MTTKLNLFVPQWQDSGSTNELYDGAYALKSYIEKKGVGLSEIKIPRASDLKITENILGYPTIVSQLDEIFELVLNRKPERIFSIGGAAEWKFPWFLIWPESIKIWM